MPENTTDISCQLHIVESPLEGYLSQRTGKTLVAGIAAVITDDSGSNTSFILDVIADAVRSKKYDLVVAPEYSFMPKSGPLSVEELNCYLETFKKLSLDGVLIVPGTFVWQENGLVRNTCFFFDNGNVVLRYDKNSDGGLSDIAARYGLKPVYGTIPGKYNRNGIDIIAEICFDGGLHAKRGDFGNDLVLLISWGNCDLPRSMDAIKPGGYGILADGYSELRAYLTRKKDPNPILAHCTKEIIRLWEELTAPEPIQAANQYTEQIIRALDELLIPPRVHYTSRPKHSTSITIRII